MKTPFRNAIGFEEKDYGAGVRNDDKKPFAVGDRVCVMSRCVPRSVTTVTRVMKRFVETEGGDKWSTDGTREYPRPEFSWSSNYPSIVHLTPEHEKYIAEYIAEAQAHGRLLNTLTGLESALRNAKLAHAQIVALQSAIDRAMA